MLLVCLGFSLAAANCLVEEVLSPRIANYTMQVRLDDEAKKVEAKATIVWHNTSPDTVSELRFYMYLNAFKNNKSSYLKDVNGQFFGQRFLDRKAEEWGYVTITSLFAKGLDLTSNMSYVQNLDDNKDDQSLLSVPLVESVLPGDSITLTMEFVSKLPKTMVRSGYSKDKFFHWVHWYPKLGVYEQNEQGVWGWNCHQFFRQMEFYGDFGVYDITLDLSEELVLGASGCRVSEEASSEGRVQYRYIARDVIDFAWTAYPFFEEFTDTYEHIKLRLLIPPEHCALAPRLLEAAKAGLVFLDDKVGKYPYNQLTIIDPPVHALNSGFMEYPTLITGGSFYAFPSGIRTIESLIIHELSHQYFMGLLASNEKEAPWLDEGFVTFYEDRIMEASYGRTSSLFEILGLKIPNSALTRDEYTSQRNLRTDAITTKSWEIKGDYKSTVYSKTALVLTSLMRYIGEDKFDNMMREYFEHHRFTHPRKADFIHHVRTACERACLISDRLDEFLAQAIDGTAICDYAVTSISHRKLEGAVGLFDVDDQLSYIRDEAAPDLYVSTIRLERREDFLAPVRVQLTWDDGSTRELTWTPIQAIFDLQITDSRRVVSAYIDPLHQLAIDIDYNNNSLTLQTHRKALWKYADRAIFWVQHIMQASSFLM